MTPSGAGRRLPVDLSLLPRTHRRTQLASVLVGLGIAAFALLGAGMRRGYSWDRWFLGFTHLRFEGPFDELVNGVAVGTTIVGGVLAGGVLLLLLRLRRQREALFWALALAGILILDLTLKPLFHRTPISHSDGYSFPSGNAMAAMGGVVGLILIFEGSAIWKRLLLVIGCAAVAANGFAVVYLRWHYPSDVLAGWCVAGAWIYLLWLLLAPPHADALPATVDQELVSK